MNRWIHTMWIRRTGVAVLLTAVWAIVSAGAFLAFDQLFPGSARLSALLALVILSVVAALGMWHQGWRRIGWTVERLASHRLLLVVIGLLSAAPLIAGFREIAATEAVFLIVGYALTGFAEEGFFRGLVQAQLEGLKLWQVALAVGVLFGAVHLGNLLIRDNAAIVVAQAFGAGLHGFGFAVLRRRLDSIVPLAVAHFAADLCLHLGNLPLVPMAAVDDTLFFALGLFVLFRPAEHSVHIGRNAATAPSATEPACGGMDDGQQSRVGTNAADSARDKART